ncbi:MAG: ATP-binding protein [Deltaproteobacteria bacterium]|nr:ATP-binding protein [Deltaproteobacteria bacterium]
MPLIPRHFGSRLKALLSQFPAVCILGARQCGKTTFAKLSLPDWRYLDLEKPSDLVKIEASPGEALTRWGGQIIFDEAQRFPELFPLLRSLIDEKRDENGRFVLLGSASFSLIKNISESLAGRIGFLDMTPLQADEVSSWESLWIHGGFPKAFLEEDPSRRNEWFEGYLRTFIERDLGQLGLQVSAPQMRQLCQMVSHLHGGILNASELGSSLGVNYHTVNRYIDILEQTYLVRRLRPYFRNIGKRLVKSPKIYIRDTGLLHHLLNINSDSDLEGHPKRGMSWEGFVIEQITGWLSLNSPGTQIYYWRTATNQEADLLLEKGQKIIPIEIKIQTAPRRDDIHGLFSCMADLQLKQGYVIRPRGERYPLSKEIEVLTLHELLTETLPI